MLLKRDVNPDKPDKDGRTPPYRAALNGREGVAKTLPYSSEMMSALTDLITMAKHHLVVLPHAATQEWLKYCLDGTASTLTGRENLS